MPRKIILTVLISLTVLWTAFIYSNSLESAEESSEKSSTVTEIVNEVASAVGVEEEIPHSTVRSMAHFTEFAVLAVLLCADAQAALWSHFRKKPLHLCLAALASVLACFLLATVDELLQKLSDGRVCDFSDVLLDTSGALTGAVCFALIFYIAVFISKKRHKV